MVIYCSGNPLGLPVLSPHAAPRDCVSLPGPGLCWERLLMHCVVACCRDELHRLPQHLGKRRAGQRTGWWLMTWGRRGAHQRTRWWLMAWGRRGAHQRTGWWLMAWGRRGAHQRTRWWLMAWGRRGAHQRTGWWLMAWGRRGAHHRTGWWLMALLWTAGYCFWRWR